jgi:AcrR family transcriptional regulator
MSITATKQRILDASIILFNENGLSNVRLQQIADQTGISVGNLAYHFKNKEAIITFVYETIFEEYAQILSAYLIHPNLIDIDNQLTHYFAFFQKYRFYLVDLFEIERSFPTINDQWHQYVNKMLMQIRKRIDFNVQRGILISEPHKDIYDLLTNNIWMSIIFWIPQQILRGMPVDETLFKEAVWSQMMPYFSDKGTEEYMNLIYPILKSE